VVLNPTNMKASIHYAILACMSESVQSASVREDQERVAFGIMCPSCERPTPLGYAWVKIGAGLEGLRNSTSVKSGVGRDLRVD
jgi:hypothetical protein